MATHEITDETFDAEIQSDIPVVVDFWAEWCGPCKKMAPHLEAVADELSGKVKIVKINVEEHPMASSKYAVRGLPTLMIFKDGKMIDRHAGAMSKQSIADWIESAQA